MPASMNWFMSVLQRPGTSFTWSLVETRDLYEQHLATWFRDRWSMVDGGLMLFYGQTFSHHSFKLGMAYAEETALPPDVRRWLGPAVSCALYSGLGPWCGLCPWGS